MTLNSLQPSASKTKRSAQEYRQAALDLSRRQVSAGKTVRMRVVTDSMLPALQPGDTVTVTPVSTGQLAIGDLVVVSREEVWITHRLVAIKAQEVVTKGDNRAQSDPPIAKNAILGKITAVERTGTSFGLQHVHWSVANRLLGWLGWAEMILYRTGRRLFAFLGRPNDRRPHAVAVLIRFPVRLLRWALITMVTRKRVQE